MVRNHHVDELAIERTGGLEGGLVPEKRWGLPEDIAEAVAALASGAFAFSQGQVIEVDGGLALPRL